MHIRKYSFRFILFFTILILFLGVFIVRLMFLQVFGAADMIEKADQQHNLTVELEPVRGGVYDRRGRPFAFNVSVYSLYANPRSMSEADKKEALHVLPQILGVDKGFLKERLDRGKYFVWIKRKLTLDIVEKIKSYDISGIAFIPESKRFYPNGELAAHVVGFAGIDNHGLEGIELAYDRDLRGVSGKAMVLRDARQRELMLDKNYVAPVDGFNINLTIDETIQYLAEESLEKMFKKENAKAASIIIMDIKTGEVLALANRPTYNLSRVDQSNVGDRTNRAISYIYEPGSVFKIVAASGALEEKAFKETDKIFCENGSWKVGSRLLHDHMSHGTLTFREVVEQSSNIGMAKIGVKLGKEHVYNYAKKFRFGQLTGIDLQGEVRGVIPSISQWSKLTITSIPMGHEVTVTPLQLVAAIAAIANDGVYMRPFVVKSITDSLGHEIKSFSPHVLDRIISVDTAKRMQSILTGVVEQGTGKMAKIKGVLVAGKTGTAQKIINGQYSHDAFFASFIGFAPADNPKLAAVVVFDDPHPNHFGGTVSAPVFKEVIEKSLKYLESTGYFLIPKIVEEPSSSVDAIKPAAVSPAKGIYD